MGIVVGGIVGEVKCAYKPVRAMITHEKELLKNEIDRVLDFKFLTKAIEE